AGAFVSIDGSGKLRVERGYVRLEDEPAVHEHELEGEAESNGIEADSPGGTNAQRTGSPVSEEREEEEEQGIKPIPDWLMTELTAYRTLALRDALAQDPDVAFLAALHALSLKLFYRYTSESCLDIDVKSVVFGSQVPGLNDTAMAKAVDERHRRWSEQLPRAPGRASVDLNRFQMGDYRQGATDRFKPDWTKHAKAAPFKRNDAMLELLPIGVMHFPGTGIQDNLADKARRLGIAVWKFGGA